MNREKQSSGGGATPTSVKTFNNGRDPWTRRRSTVDMLKGYKLKKTNTVLVVKIEKIKR